MENEKQVPEFLKEMATQCGEFGITDKQEPIFLTNEQIESNLADITGGGVTNFLFRCYCQLCAVIIMFPLLFFIWPAQLGIRLIDRRVESGGKPKP